MIRFSAFVIAGLLGIASPMAVVAQEAAAAPAAPVLPAITVTPVAMVLLRDRVIASGLVGAVEQVQVQPLIEGQPIESLEVDVGDRVTEGQVLARLSLTTLELQRSQFVASLASAEALIAQAEAQMLETQSSADEAQRVSDRTATLKEQGTASQAAADQALAAAVSAQARVTVAVQTLEAARAQVALVNAQLANVDLQLQRTAVVAPVAGEVIERNAQVGSIASAAGNPMFVVIRDNALELRAEMAERDLLRVQPGQSVVMTAVGSTTPLTGTVRLVEPTIDITTRLGTARISIDTPELVRSGMFADAEILVVERETLAVPVSAIGSSPDGTTAMKVVDGRVSRVVVETGIRDGAMIEILSGLTEGDMIVTKAGAFVRDGDMINPVPAVVSMN
jgi:HlyD family secretion protein